MNLVQKDLATTDELEDLLRSADRTLTDMVVAYEPIEASYRTATESFEPVVEVTNTGAVPRAYVTSTTSAK